MVRRFPTSAFGAVLLLFASVVVGAPPDTSSSSELGLREALLALRDAGLRLTFSDALVKAEYRVEGPVDTTGDLHGQAVEILRPFDLRLARTSTGLWYVVRASEPRGRENAPGDQQASVEGTLEEMVVSAPRYRLVRTTRERRSLDQRMLRTVPALGGDPMRAINQLPGQASVGISARHHIRGGDANEVLYLIDGVELIEPFHLSDFQALFSVVNPALVDVVDVYHAGFPVAFGSRLSGIIDVDLVEPERPLQGHLDVNLVSASAQALGNTGNVSWLASVRRSLIDEVFHFLEQDYGEPSFNDGLLRLSIDGERSEWTWGIFNGADELRLEDEDAGESATADYHNFMTWIRGEQQLSDDLNADLTVSYTTVDNTREGILDDPVDAVGALQESREFQVAEGRAAVRWRPGPRWSVHAGARAAWQQGKFWVDMASDHGPLGARLQAGPLRRDVAVERDGTLYAAFASVGFEPTAQLYVEAGVRYEMQDIDPVHDRQWSPRLHARYASDAGWLAFVDLGRYTQHQNLYELQIDDGLLALNEPQYGDQLSVGLGWPWRDDWRIAVEVYGRRVRDPWQRFDNLYNPWVLLPELHADRVRTVPERARAYGTELSVDYQPDIGPHWSLSYAVARARERVDGHWRSRPWEQTRTGRLMATWQTGHWDLGLALTYHRGWPTTPRLTEADAVFFEDRLPDYFSLDVHVARTFPLALGELEVYLDVGNATGAENVGGYRFELDDGGLEREPRRLLPRVPVIGLSWSW